VGRKSIRFQLSGLAACGMEPGKKRKHFCFVFYLFLNVKLLKGTGVDKPEDQEGNMKAK